MDYTVFFTVDHAEFDVLLTVPNATNDHQATDNCLSDIPTSIT